MDSRTQGLPRSEVVVALLVLACGITFAGLALMMGSSRHVGVIICAVTVSISIFVSPLIGLCFTCVAIMLVDSFALAVVKEYATIAKVLAGITALSFLFRLTVEHHGAQALRRGSRSITLRWYAFLGVWPLILTPFAIATPYDQFMMLSTQFSMVGLVFLIGAIPTNLRQLEVIILITCAGCAILGVYTVVVGFPGAGTGGLSEAKVSHAMACAMAMAMILSIIPLKNSGRVMQLALVAGDVLLGVAIFFTLSRSTWVGLAACILVPPTLVPGVPLRYRIAHVSVAAGLALLAIYLLGAGVFGDYWHPFLERAKSSIDAHQSAQRLEVAWPQAIAIAKSHFLIGGGPGAQRAWDMWGHNIFLQVVLESGLIGLTFFGLFLLATVREAIRNADPILRLCSLCVICFWMVEGQFMHPLFTPSFALSLGVLVCMANLGLCAREGRHPLSHSSVSAYHSVVPALNRQSHQLYRDLL